MSRTSLRVRPHSFVARAGVIAGAVGTMSAFAGSALQAQDRLVSTGVVAIGATADGIRIGKGGYTQPGALGRDSVRVRNIDQVGLPISMSVPVGAAWTVDLQSLFSQIRVGYAPRAGVSGPNGRETLSGMSDVRVRLTGRLLSDAVVLTVGANIPTGQTHLTGPDFLVLQAASAPGLGLGSPPVGTGPSGTVGLVAARQLLGGALAAGVSYERRGTYQPIAALAAGAPSADFRPGDVTRLSLGFDRLVGRHRLVLTAAADLFNEDVLHDRAVAVPTVASVKLGPVYTLDAQMHLGIARVREFVVWGANRYRSRFERDGVEVAGSNANYFDGGVRTRVPLARTVDLLLTLDGRAHSGLAINQGLATARTSSAGSTVGLVVQRGRYSIQPYLRGRVGSLEPRATGATSLPFSGFSTGLVLVTRF